jgi:hypothetical protein
MNSIMRDVVLIVAAALAEAFLLWALWNFLRASRRRPSRRAWEFGERAPQTSPTFRTWQDRPVAATSRVAMSGDTQMPVRRPMTSVR